MNEEWGHLYTALSISDEESQQQAGEINELYCWTHDGPGFGGWSCQHADCRSNALSEQKPLLDWKDQPIQPPQQETGNPMTEREGPCSIEKATCQHCEHIYELYKFKPERRCDFRGDAKHLMRWPACAKFELREGPMRIYDGRR